MEQRCQIRSYVLRQGRVSNAQKRAYQTNLPRFGVAFIERLLNFSEIFGRSAPTFLEIGFGMGETTATIAKQHPEHNYLGLEVHTPGLGSLLRKIEECELTNIRIIQHDAVEVLSRMIPQRSLNGVNIFFPDPWPKTRHHKRRLIQPSFVSLLVEKLLPGSQLQIATDWENYAQHITAVLQNEPRLWRVSSNTITRPKTKFERRGLTLGHQVWNFFYEVHDHLQN